MSDFNRRNCECEAHARGCAERADRFVGDEYGSYAVCEYCEQNDCMGVLDLPSEANDEKIDFNAMFDSFLASSIDP